MKTLTTTAIIAHQQGKKGQTWVPLQGGFTANEMWYLPKQLMNLQSTVVSWGFGVDKDWPNMRSVIPAIFVLSKLLSPPQKKEVRLSENNLKDCILLVPLGASAK